ncbi:MAG: response regulator transcription factor [Bdellovibrionaceae bacterium]|nr:response regulator transcription factor [Pseudobdellovibrionaceae bacterium]NUM59618.1 response regulator transcription factor [Pseudobdellovibrionaceae bacterium]
MKILSIEDSKESQVLIDLALNKQFEVDFADDYTTGIGKISISHYDCILMDINLPDSNGFNIFSQLNRQQIRKIPIIFLSAEACEMTIANAFNMGADDYIVKPIKPIELAARVANRIIKSNRVFEAEYTTGPFKFNLQTSRVYFCHSNNSPEILLTPIEFKILFLLAKNHHRIYSRTMLINELWGNDYYLESRSVDKHISSLRRKINPYGNLIKTQSGKGYCFELQADLKEDFSYENRNSSSKRN